MTTLLILLSITGTHPTRTFASSPSAEITFPTTIISSRTTDRRQRPLRTKREETSVDLNSFPHPLTNSTRALGTLRRSQQANITHNGGAAYLRPCQVDEMKLGGPGFPLRKCATTFKNTANFPANLSLTCASGAGAHAPRPSSDDAAAAAPLSPPSRGSRCSTYTCANAVLATERKP